MSLPATLDPVLSQIAPALSEATRARLQPVHLAQGAVLQERQPREVLLPAGCVLSLLADGGLQLAVIGSEGVLGLDALSESARPGRARAVVHCSGPAFQLRADLFRRELERNEALQQRVLRFSLALLDQIGTLAACRAQHAAGDQVVRWLRQVFERAAAPRCAADTASLAALLGLPEAAVAAALEALQARGIVAMERGHLELIDRARLEAAGCDCHAALRQAYRLPLGACGVPPARQDAGDAAPSCRAVA